MIKYNNNTINKLATDATVNKMYYGSNVAYIAPPLVEPSFQVKWLATYVGGTTSSAECDSTSEITSGEITLTDLETVIIGNCTTSIGTSAFYQCSSLTSVDIPSSVTSIGERAFRYCYSLTSIEIPNSVTSMGTFIFSNCTGLTSCTIGSGVTSIGNNSFAKCTSLTSIDIPSGVTSIGNTAFGGCSGLTSITVNAVTPPTLGTNVFDKANYPIYVPSGSVETYKSASGWSTYASRIQAIL